MAVFKPKKTYIKRYASKNIDKKIKFADNITAEFGLGGKKAKSPVSSATTDVIKNEKSADMHISEAKSAIEKIEYRPKYRFTSVEGDGLIRPAESASVNTRKNSNVNPDTELGNAKAELRGDNNTINNESKQPKQTHSQSADLVLPNNKSAQKEYCSDTSACKETDTYSDDTSYMAEQEQETHSAVALAEKSVESQPLKESEIKVSDEAYANPTEKAADMRVKSKRNVLSVIMTVVCVIAVVAAGGYFGKDFINAQIERTRAISEELAVMYAPEDYVYPEIPSGVAQKVKAARDAAYREAMANAYVPKRAEVPNLYKYDYVKTCYLTFDDGPSAEVTSSILDTLKKYNVPATFFVVGKNAEQYPELIKRMDAEGHSIGNHSYSHNYEYMYSGDSEFDSEMIACKNAINNILGRNYGNMLYRFPGGSFEVYKQYYIWNIESEGYQYVDWNALTGDSEVQNPDAEYIMNALKESTNNGTAEDIVVLMHDAGAKKITADTLPQVIEYLKSKNYVFKAVKNSNFISQ